MLVQLILIGFFANLSLSLPAQKLPENRIVNGIETDIKEIPYQVSLTTETNHLCGGVLIARQWVLTAAHCITRLIEGDHIPYLVRIGSSDSQSGGILVHPIGEVIHPQYLVEKSQDFDLGLVLIEHVNWDLDNLKTAQWPGCEQRRCQPGDLLQVSGWGFNFIEDPEKKTKLQSIRVPIISTEKCTEMWQYEGVIENRNLCAGDLENKRDARIGDSGGPGTCRNDLIALVSGGLEYGMNDQFELPGVYTDLTHIEIQEWIELVTGIKKPCEGQNNKDLYYYELDRQKY